MTTRNDKLLYKAESMNRAARNTMTSKEAQRLTRLADEEEPGLEKELARIYSAVRAVASANGSQIGLTCSDEAYRILCENGFSVNWYESNDGYYLFCW